MCFYVITSRNHSCAQIKVKLIFQNEYDILFLNMLISKYIIFSQFFFSFHKIHFLSETSSDLNNRINQEVDIGERIKCAFVSFLFILSICTSYEYNRNKKTITSVSATYFDVFLETIVEKFLKSVIIILRDKQLSYIVYRKFSENLYVYEK